MLKKSCEEYPNAVGSSIRSLIGAQNLLNVKRVVCYIFFTRRWDQSHEYAVLKTPLCSIDKIQEEIPVLSMSYQTPHLILSNPIVSY